GLRDQEIDQDPIAVPHQGVSHEHQLRYFPPALAQEAGFRIRRAPVGGGRALLAVEVHRWIAWVIIGALGRLPIAWREALQTGRCLDQRPVHREVLIGEQTPPKLKSCGHSWLSMRRCGPVGWPCWS